MWRSLPCESDGDGAAPSPQVTVTAGDPGVIRERRGSVSVVRGSHDPVADGAHRCLDAVLRAELAQDARDVVLDGRGADEQPAADRGVVAAFGEEAEHLDLAGSEVGHRRRRMPTALLVSSSRAKIRGEYRLHDVLLGSGHSQRI